MSTSQQLIDKLKKSLEYQVTQDVGLPYSTRMNIVTFGIFGSRNSGYGKKVTAVMNLIDNKLSGIKKNGGSVTLNSYVIREELHFSRFSFPLILYGMLMKMETSDTFEAGVKNGRLKLDSFLQIRYEREANNKLDRLTGTGTKTTSRGKKDKKDGTGETGTGTKTSTGGKKDKKDETGETGPGTKTYTGGKKDKKDGTGETGPGTKTSTGGKKDKKDETGETGPGTKTYTGGKKDKKDETGETGPGTKTSTGGKKDKKDETGETGPGTKTSTGGKKDKKDETGETGTGTKTSTGGKKDKKDGTGETGPGTKTSTGGKKDKKDGTETQTDKDAAYYNKTGDQYLEGDGVPKDEKKAYNCYKKAAEMNDAEGLYNLAWCLQNGIGIAKSVPKAKEYYLKSADMGFAKAMAKYAFILFFGVENDNDPALKESFEYMKKAADAGNADAQARIAQAYQEDGWGAPEINYDLAKDYLMKAVDQGNEHAMWILAENYYDGNFGWPEDREAAYEYYRKAAEAGSVKAMTSYTSLLFFGDNNLDRSFDSAYQWAEKAYDNGGDVRPWYGALTVRKAYTGKFSQAQYKKGVALLQQSIEEDGDRRAGMFLHRLGILEKYEKPCSEKRIDNIIYLVFIQTDLCLDQNADEKEILAEIEYPEVFRDALSGNCYACAALSSLFVNNQFNDKRGPYPLTNLLSLKLGEKWAEKAYETKNLDGIETYLRMLGIVAYTDFKVGAYDVTVRKIEQMRKVIKEINAIPDYTGHFSKPDVLAGYYLTEADALYELHEFDRAVRTYKECIKLNETPDANFGIAACLFVQEDNTYFKWLEKALRMDNWYDPSNQSAAMYFAANVYRDGIGVPADINTSYEWMKKAADLNHPDAKQELARYKKVRNGYQYQ